MLTAASLATVEAHWAAFLGCTIEELRGQDIVVPQRGRGIFILSRAGAVVAVPPGVAADLKYESFTTKSPTDFSMFERSVATDV